MLKELKLSHDADGEKRKALTVEQQNLLFAFLSEHEQYHHWYPVFYIMCNTGMRVGEITGLRWRDVDLDEKLISVNHTLVYYNHRDEKGCYFSINTPKTKAGERTIPMTDEVKAAFIMEREYQYEAQIQSVGRVDGYDDFIFVNKDGNVQNQGALNKALKRIIRDCNCEVLERDGVDSNPVLLPNFSCHHLRHTFATRLCEWGINLKVIQDVLGHADVSTTMNIYVDVTNDLKKKELNSFSEYLNNNLTNKPEITTEQLNTAIANAVQQVRTNLLKFSEKYKYSNSENNFYEASEIVEWTTGFWTGEVWLAYENSGDELFKETALKQVDSFLNRIENHIDTNHHDMGFLYSPSCVAAYKLTGSETAKKAALLAADNLISRFQEKGQFIQAWGELGAEDNYRLIIDCLLNLPLLYWATDVTGDAKYADIAQRHITTALKLVMRRDSSTFHTYFFDKATGEPTRGVTAQGYRDGSAWARGQAWGIYGVALGYKYVRDPEYVEIFEKVTDFFIEHLPENLVPYWDFDFTDGSDEPRDSSSSAIAACGMLEMAKYLPAEKAEYYTKIAKQLVAALVTHCAVSDPKISNGQLLHGTYARKSDFNTVRNRGVDECNTWGDYYYFEALTRLVTDWKVYW
ncbi:MAG: hypothetical protein EOM30_07925 [Clostridia bacterium]|nr:hypothetical protein [Clostridia bacterium]